MAEKTAADLKKDALFYKQKNGCERVGADEAGLVNAYCEDYKHYLDESKTEREAVREAVRLAQAAGFVPLTAGMPLKAGDKVYYVNRDKAMMLAVIGSRGLSEGANIAAAHIDAPRLDLKQNPLYEDSELAYFKTHYYGGIKKYQWVAIPLELHGVVSMKDGRNIEVVIGRDARDPVFVITDLLPHLAADQYKKNLAESFPGESLNILLGSRPFGEKCDSDSVKLNIMAILNEKYGITEEDFLSAEIAAVPAGTSRDLGLDRSLIGGYGHDDRVCAYAALRAVLEAKTPARTAVCILADKEEIGSEGVSGMKSAAFDTFMKTLCDAQSVDLGRCFSNSCCLSADVCNAYDPNYADVSDKRNNARINYGVGICKYTGSRGKSGSSDASAELVAKIRRLLDANGVVWQMAELGKVDQGGGGTVAVYMAERNIDTIDAGVPVLSMHAPFEAVSKLDAYMTYRAVAALYGE